MTDVELVTLVQVQYPIGAKLPSEVPDGSGDLTARLIGFAEQGKIPIQIISFFRFTWEIACILR